MSVHPCFYDDEDVIVEIMNHGISSRADSFQEPSIIWGNI